MLKPLLRTIPQLSGNVKLGCTLTDWKETSKNTYETVVRGARILPISSQLRQYTDIKANLLGSTWEYDLKHFYANYSDIFFKDCYSFSTNDVMLLDKSMPLKPRNTDFECGVKRVSYIKNGAQFAFFAPIYAESLSDLPDCFQLEMTFKVKSGTLTKKINIIIGGDNVKSSRNYLKTYLTNYLRSIDSNVAFVNQESKSMTYFGIDLINGGFCKKVDTKVAKMFDIVLPMQKFDHTLGSGFESNSICMKQVIPLCFYIDVDNVLSGYDHSLYDNGDITFSGHYYKNGNRIDWYDFSHNYDEFAQNILTFDDVNGMFGYRPGYIKNIMDCGFPALNEKHIDNYNFVNKLSTSFCRWKLKYSDDDYPYITNLSWAFSTNQDNNYKYREFPTTFVSQSAVATVDLGLDNNYHYNLIYPIGNKNIYIYDRYNALSAEKYKNIYNNYCLNWFNVIPSLDDLKIDDGGIWKSTEDDKVYYNGILWDLTNVYNESVNVKEDDKIDRFAVLAYVDTSDVKHNDSELGQLKFVDYTLITSKGDINISDPNCNAFDEICYNIGTDSNYLFNTTATSYNDIIEYNNIFVKDDDGKYIECSTYNGLDYYELNKYYNAADHDLYGKTLSYIEDFKKQNPPKYVVDAFDDSYKSYMSYLHYAAEIVFNSSTFNPITYFSAAEELPIYRSKALVKISDENEDEISIFDPELLTEGPDSEKKFNADGYDISNNVHIVDSNLSVKHIASEWYDDPDAVLSDGPLTFSGVDMTMLNDPYKNLLVCYKKFINARSINWMDSSDIPEADVHTWLVRNVQHLTKETEAAVMELSKALLGAYKSVIHTFIKDSNIIEYRFNPERQDNRRAYVKNVMTKTKWCGNLYEDNAIINSLHDDKDVLYVSKYNLQNLYEYYNTTYGTSYDIDTIKYESFYGRLLSKDHFRAWYNELHKDERCKSEDGWANSWMDKVFISKKVLARTPLGVECKNVYVNIRDIFGNVDFNTVYTAVYFDAPFAAFYIDAEWADALKEHYPYDYFDICIKDDFVRMDASVWSIMNLNGNVDTPYKDFYIYRVFGTEEYDKKYFSNSNGKYLGDTIEFIGSTEYQSLMMNYDVTETDTMLTPMYNDIYAQEKVDTVIYEHWNLDSIMPVHFIVDGQKLTNYRYNKNSAVMMIYVTPEDLAYLKDHIDHDIERFTNYSAKSRLDLLTDGAKSHLESQGFTMIPEYNKSTGILAFRNPEDGLVYGCYLMHVLLDNTYDTFNIKGYIDEQHTSEALADDIENNNIKYIKYINGVDITAHPEYLVKEFKHLCPFMYVNPINAIRDLNTYIKPSIFNLKVLYQERIKDNTNESTEMLVNVGDVNFIQQKEILQRYMNAVVPYICKTNVVPDQYYQKYKNVQADILETGEFPSIGDSILYKIDAAVDAFAGYRVYGMYDDNNEDVKVWDHTDLEYYKRNYNAVKEIFTPIEYKHYNASKAVNLKTKFSIEDPKYHTYEELLALETFENTFELFKHELLKTHNQLSDCTDAEILFLYKQYDVQYDTVPKKLNITNAVKLYSLTYKFKLL